MKTFSLIGRAPFLLLAPLAVVAGAAALALMLGRAPQVPTASAQACTSLTIVK